MVAGQSVQPMEAANKESADLGSILNQSIHQREKMLALESQMAEKERLAEKQEFPQPERIR